MEVLCSRSGIVACSLARERLCHVSSSSARAQMMQQYALSVVSLSGASGDGEQVGAEKSRLVCIDSGQRERLRAHVMPGSSFASAARVRKSCYQLFDEMSCKRRE
jgi:hypothetical protein